jgi:hypothetical protein
MFSWGTGSYAALGFGSRENVKLPRELLLNEDSKILKISCGRHHSMCIT